MLSKPKLITLVACLVVGGILIGVSFQIQYSQRAAPVSISRDDYDDIVYDETSGFFWGFREYTVSGGPYGALDRLDDTFEGGAFGGVYFDDLVDGYSGWGFTIANEKLYLLDVNSHVTYCNVEVTEVDRTTGAQTSVLSKQFSFDFLPERLLYQHDRFYALDGDQILDLSSGIQYSLVYSGSNIDTVRSSPENRVYISCDDGKRVIEVDLASLATTGKPTIIHDNQISRAPWSSADFIGTGKDNQLLFYDARNIYFVKDGQMDAPGDATWVQIFVLGIAFIAVGLLVTVGIQAIKAKKQRTVEKTAAKNITQIDNIEEIARKYCSTQLQGLRQEIPELTPAKIDERVRENLAKEIKKLAALIELSGQEPPPETVLIDYCYQQSASIREQLKDLLKSHLEQSILNEKPLDEGSIQQEIDDLIAAFADWERTGRGKKQ